MNPRRVRSCKTRLVSVSAIATVVSQEPQTAATTPTTTAPIARATRHGGIWQWWPAAAERAMVPHADRGRLALGAPV